jgi:hypothetical protein
LLVRRCQPSTEIERQDGSYRSVFVSHSIENVLQPLIPS